jgi:hypothetical protein
MRISNVILVSRHQHCEIDAKIADRSTTTEQTSAGAPCSVCRRIAPTAPMRINNVILVSRHQHCEIDAKIADRSTTTEQTTAGASVFSVTSHRAHCADANLQCDSRIRRSAL